MIPSQSATIRYYTARNGRDYYNEWLSALDDRTRAIVLRHVNKLAQGIGFRKDLGHKLWELVIDFGPGYRVYFKKEGNALVIVFAGSDKSGQKRTIELVRRLIKEIEEEK